MNDLKRDLINFWPEAAGKIHLDAWREVTRIDGYNIAVIEVTEDTVASPYKLFFLNLGGYRKDEFGELHYKMLVVANGKADAIRQAKQTAFYKHNGFTGPTSHGATSHIDEKYGVDVDDVFEIMDVLPTGLKMKYKLLISKVEGVSEDEIHLGYMRIEKL